MEVNERKSCGACKRCVCGKRFVAGCMRKGSEWWNEGGTEKEGV